MTPIVHVMWTPWASAHIWDRHKIPIEEVEAACFDPASRLIRGRDGRHVVLGRTEAGRYLLIIGVLRASRFRVISAREMTKRERQILRK